MHRRLFSRLRTTPGTIADDLGCAAALAALGLVAWGLLILHSTGGAA